MLYKVSIVRRNTKKLLRSVTQCHYLLHDWIELGEYEQIVDRANLYLTSINKGASPWFDALSYYQKI
ncbi:hypothetical protein MAH1_21080 [Sessilibacter sp. MAH1]